MMCRAATGFVFCFLSFDIKLSRDCLQVNDVHNLSPSVQYCDTIHMNMHPVSNNENNYNLYLQGQSTSVMDCTQWPPKQATLARLMSIAVHHQRQRSTVSSHLAVDQQQVQLEQWSQTCQGEDSPVFARSHALNN
jgi:flagellar biosynthesis chaperone FliJ